MTSRLALVLLLIAALAVGGWTLWRYEFATALPEGIAVANGRVEATQVDIATRISGRVLEVLPREGDMVEAGALIARLDSAEIDAQVQQARAEVERARQSLAAAQATRASREAELLFARQELHRSEQLADQGYAPQERLDERRQLVQTALAALNASAAAIDEATAAIAVAEAAAQRMEVLQDDTRITSPVRGRVQYRLIEPGAVLAAGGRIATVLDLTDVWMTIFLPAEEAGRLRYGAEARIVLDAAPDYVFPANVSFVAAEAQFTPKTVETQSEREDLMFRVKLRAPADMLRRIEDRVKVGLRGVAYVRIDPETPWPEDLALRLPD